MNDVLGPLRLFSLLLGLALVGCPQGDPVTPELPSPSTAQTDPWPAADLGAIATTGEDPPGVEGGDKAPLAVVALEPVGVGRFVTSTGCAMCHSNHDSATAMRDSRSDEIAPFNLWQGTMMANAARDPFWRAVVSAEIAATPSRAEDIEAECIRCHAPMASVTAEDYSLSPSMAWAKMGDSAEGQMFSDGVACTVCHQILDENLGEDASFSGGFTLGTERKIFGPHLQPATGPMQHHVDYTPTYSSHILKPGLCATCHTIETQPKDADGQDLEGHSYLEQSPFLEWQASDYYQGDPDSDLTCQDCHMPTEDNDGNVIFTRIARSPPGGDFLINPRSPFGRHLFVGANTALPGLIKRERATLKPQATDEAFDAVVAMARRRLSEDTATIGIEDVGRGEGGTLTFGVRINSQVGHKLPTGFPSRRVFVHVRVLGADDAVLFESGAFNDQGRLTAQGAVLDIEKAGGPIEGHHDTISRPDQVAIFQQVMVDNNGAPTFTVLRATGKFKDNRLLPPGATPDKPSYNRIAPVGVDEDPDFGSGGDIVHFTVQPGAEPVRIEASLYYQGLSPRFLREVFQVDTAEVRAFRSMLEDSDVMPETIAAATLDIDVDTLP